MASSPSPGAFIISSSSSSSSSFTRSSHLLVTLPLPSSGSRFFHGEGSCYSRASFKARHPLQLCRAEETVKEMDAVGSTQPTRMKTAESTIPTKEKNEDSDEATRKYGLEVGLWKIFTSKSSGDKDSKLNKKNQAKELLTRYGGAYLVTSITLSAISFSLCYFLISSGVDVANLLEKVGVHIDATGEKVGTFALAYAAHKAASPIRFPPTVALTPIVANWFGKSSKENTTEKFDQ